MKCPDCKNDIVAADYEVGRCIHYYGVYRAYYCVASNAEYWINVFGNGHHVQCLKWMKMSEERINTMMLLK